MVMGPTHAASGALGWLVAVAFFGTILTVFQTDSMIVILLGMLVTAGASLAPDIDSNSSTITRSFGPITKGLHTLVDGLSVSVYTMTKTRRDSDRNNGHRTLFHTPLVAAIIGLLVSGAVSLPGEVEMLGDTYSYGQITVLLVAFVFTYWAILGLFPEQAKKGRKKWGFIVPIIFSFFFTASLLFIMPTDETYVWLGPAVAFGWFIHLLGDAITKLGVPLLFPFKWRGKRWWDVTLPAFMRIKAGGTFEKVVLLPACTVGVVVMWLYILGSDVISHVPGGISGILDMFS